MLGRSKDTVSAALVEGCDAMLEGRYVEYLESRHQPVPTWAWVNVLAHGGIEDLRRVRSESLTGRRRRATIAWRQSRAYLAGEVLAVVDGLEGALAAFQVRALVPVELRLSERAEEERLTPGDLVASLLSALDVERRFRRRREAAGIDDDPPVPR